MTPERSIDLCLQTFPKLLLLLVPKVTKRSLYPECIANLKLPIDAFYRESRSGVNIAKRNITTGLFGLVKSQHKFTVLDTGTYKMRNETYRNEMKRNEIYQNEMKRNEIYRNETERNETK